MNDLTFGDDLRVGDPSRREGTRGGGITRHK
jgi:hypothetical protein